MQMAFVSCICFLWCKQASVCVVACVWSEVYELTVTTHVQINKGSFTVHLVSSTHKLQEHQRKKLKSRKSERLTMLMTLLKLLAQRQLYDAYLMLWGFDLVQWGCSTLLRSAASEV